MQVDIVPFNASWRDQSTQRTSNDAGAVIYRALTFLAVYYLLSFFVLDVDAWVVYMWSVLRRMEEGWIESDQENWEEAVRIF
ncbi:hypothetical protein NA56DRAFT_706907 [Hyaloscypha hepaticicola]|uniref:Uncharacterized protein n=1 Tax=Hyaloscypha hepaticicola TaxID=2082293 RepID=A0A2J6PW78_9HELO|nr:hypothetical protein NA56DRAFT_706907 [Hyaloscypha hepaticicola]